MIRIAHRGLHDGHPENSREALEAAFASGAHGAEVDLRMLADETIVLHHDPSLPIPGSDREGSLSAMTFDQFRSRVEYTPLTLRELLPMQPPDKRLILECKRHAEVEPFLERLEAILRDHHPLPDVLLSSFSPTILEGLLVRNRPCAPLIDESNQQTRELLHRDVWKELHLSRSLCRQETLKPLRKHYHGAILAWTVNDPGDIPRLEQLGIHGYMTDNADLLEPPTPDRGA